MMGMKSWKDFQKDSTQMYILLRDRMISISALKQPSTKLNRSIFILQTVAQQESQAKASLSKIPFLTAASCPPSYPSCLKDKWYGQRDTLYSIEDICLPNSNTGNLIGTVQPILSFDYQHSLSVRILDKLGFKKVTQEDVLKHLTKNLQSTAVSTRDAEMFNHIVLSVYEYLHEESSGLKLDFIWCKGTETPRFLHANKFVLELPKHLLTNLEPFYYCMRGPMCKYEHLFQHHGTLSLTDVADILHSIKSIEGRNLTCQQLEICLSVLTWLCEKQYKGSGILMVTEECTLVPVIECVFDDRNWMKDSKSKGQIKSKSLLFVHDRIPQKVAKYFRVVPLSRMVAPSQKLGISYTKAGQHEDITHRIRHIVQDYQTNIDIFKELIQNADDAGATEIKFLIDWRYHPTESLIAEELKEWQGPALITYNNATFSDEDFENICKVAGETKKNDPLKTGRFGVGFCATYHLTDLPSFISRRYFTMFDPHTSYLGDRISAREPGMRVDLVENQADLGLYHDQFEPYEGLFGCRVFDLKDDGYPGTLFRFPFRSLHTTSRICRTVYDQSRISELVQVLKCQSNELLLFLKHIAKVSVYELKQGCDISAIQKVFTVHRTGNSKPRIELITNYDVMRSKGNQTCVTKFVVEAQDTAEKCNSSQTTWMISSAIGTIPVNMHDCPESQGLLPLAEAAVEIKSGSELCLLPCPDLKNSKLFCFLPLPIKSEVPFHINGFFSIGKDRRNISATDDKTFGSMWNRSLAEGALISAFVNLLQSLCKESGLKDVHNTRLKQEYISSYYSLWNMSRAPGLIGSSFVAAFKQIVPTLTCPIVWSEVNGGCWLPPTDIEVFTDNKLKQDIVQDAIELLLHHGHGIVVLPCDVYEMFSKSLTSSDRVYNYKRFCNEILFPEIGKIDPKIRVRNIMFLLEQFGSYNNWYEWAKCFLRESSCIPCQNSDVLRPACQLIDPSNELFKELFDVDEGKFPSEELQKSSAALRGLVRLGMATSKLSIVDLKNRAKSVSALTYKCARTRSNKICAYIEATYGSQYGTFSRAAVPSTTEKQELLELSSIPFLPVKMKPEDVNIPWCGDIKVFDSPSRVYSPDYQHLIFSQHPVVDITSKKVLNCLEISSKRPTLDKIIAHLKCVSEHIKRDPAEKTIKFLDEAMKTVYSHLEGHHSKQDIKELAAKVKNIIWQDSHFLSPNQVVHHWYHNCVPYLCELTSTNKNFENLMRELGVENEATVEMIQNTLKQVAKDFPSPLPDKILRFVESAAGQLESKLWNFSNANLQGIYLPDEQKIMRHVSDLAENIGDVNTELVMKLPLYEEFMTRGKCYFVHKSIPRQRAIWLGVKPLLEAVLKEIEDEDFMSGADFGQYEDLCDRLNGILKKYPADVSIFKEFIQNADDAQATEIVFVLDHRTNFPDTTLLNDNPKWKSLQHTPALCIYNNRKFTEADIEGITKLGRGGKDSSPELIGKFGIGFNVAYHITDCPSFVSYTEGGAPEYLCIFDPTQSFVPSASKRSPGRKWNFKSQSHYSGFSDQFQPYLVEDLLRLSKHGPNCLHDYEKHGYVVFRLPLTRFNTYNTQQKMRKHEKSRLEFGHNFNPFTISKLFDELATNSKDMLLFLNHLRSVSSFEILKDGTCVHHFTTFGSVPMQCHQTCESFSRSLKQYTEAIQVGTDVKPVSLAHQVSITHVETNKNQQCSIIQRSQWLVQRAVGGNGLNKALLQAGLRHGLRPVGGIAAPLKSATDTTTKFGLFCFLPLPICSNLPVHVNGHFLVDDSRKHLETIEHEGLGRWNELLAQKVIIPAYVDLIVTAKDLLDTADCGWFYKLFPRPDNHHTTEKNIGELSNLNIVQSFYKELLQQNQPVLIREVSEPSSVYQWMHVKSCLFCIQFYCKKTNCQLSISDKLRSALVSLGLPITTAPNYVYSACSEADPTISISLRTDPSKIISHLQRLTCTEEHKRVIKKCIEPLLQYCVSGYFLREIPSLFRNALYLVAKDESLQRSHLFQSSFSELLPHCADKFIDPKLEESNVGEILQKVQCGVICPLPLKFVSDNIDLPTTRVSCSLSDASMITIKLLWKYLAQCLLTNNMSGNLLKSLFHSKAIIPASDDKLYPLCLSDTLVRCSCNQCNVMMKLGYPKIDLSKVRFSDQASRVKLYIIQILAKCFSKGEDIVNCFLLQEPRNFDIELTDNEALAFLSSLGSTSRECLQKVSNHLLRMPLFFTIDGSRISLSGITKVFVLDSVDMPLEGIPISHNGRVVLQTTSTQAIKNFYDRVIPTNMYAYVSPEELYLQHVLPILPKLKGEYIIKHVKHICSNQSRMTKAFATLKETAFIEHNSEFYKPSQLCDHKSTFFTTFKHDYILPLTWQHEISFLKSLGLQTEVTTTEWLECARELSEGVITANDHNLVCKSKVLLDELIVIITTNGQLDDFLQDIADLKFIYCPQHIWNLKQLLSQAFPDLEKK